MRLDSSQLLVILFILGNGHIHGFLGQFEESLSVF